MTVDDRIYSCDDHLDLWVLPRDLWEDRLPKHLRERGPRVVQQEAGDWWVADGTTLGPSGPKMMGDYSAITRAGIPDDGFRASDPALRLQDMERDGIYASVIYGPSLFGLPIADQELKAACLVAYNDWANDFNAHDRGRLSVLPVLPTHTVEAAVAELGRIAKLGHRGVILSIFELPTRVVDPVWEPLWSAAASLAVPISFHLGAGRSFAAPFSPDSKMTSGPCASLPAAGGWPPSPASPRCSSTRRSQRWSSRGRSSGTPACGSCSPNRASAGSPIS